MKPKTDSTRRKPRRNSGYATGPTKRLCTMAVSTALADALEEEAARQGVTTSVVRRQALEALLGLEKGGEA